MGRNECRISRGCNAPAGAGVALVHVADNVDESTWIQAKTRCMVFVFYLLRTIPSATQQCRQSWYLSLASSWHWRRSHVEWVQIARCRWKLSDTLDDMSRTNSGRTMSIWRALCCSTSHTSLHEPRAIWFIIAPGHRTTAGPDESEYRARGDWWRLMEGSIRLIMSSLEYIT